MGRSYSLAGKRAEAYALYCRARTLAENALQKFQAVDNADQVCIGVGFFFIIFFGSRFAGTLCKHVWPLSL